MTSFRSTGWMIRTAMAGAMLAGAASASANVLVVRSVGPSAASYPPGRSLPDNASVTLAGQDMVVLLGRNGTRTLRGPGTYSVSGPPQSRATAYSSLMRPRERARTGSVRGAGGPSSRSPWQIDPASGGTFCVGDVGDLGLWRADPHSTASVNVGRVGMPGSRALEWPAGQQVLGWPASVPVEPGVDYEIVSRGRPAARIRFIPIPAAGSDPQQLASALIEHGCDAQLEVLIGSTPEG